MTDYIYTSSIPYAITNNNGTLIVKLNKGDIVSKSYEEGDIVHCITSSGQSFRIRKDDIDKYFKRSFDYKEAEYYKQLHHKAAIAAMQGFIINGIDDKGNGEANMKYLVRTSVQVADALIQELQEAEE